MAEEAAEPIEATPPTEAEAEAKYDLHIKLNRDLQPELKDAAELAYRMGEIEKADLVDLMSLFIVWGLAILKEKWYARMGYK